MIIYHVSNETNLTSPLPNVLATLRKDVSSFLYSSKLTTFGI
jgi:hypothetical protein